ncbi:MAG: hypothetical protein ACOX4R_07045 [Lentihominibacter sp.]
MTGIKRVALNSRNDGSLSPDWWLKVPRNIHLYDSADDGKLILRESIKEDSKAEFRKVVEQVKELAKEEDLKRIEEGEKYITGNWRATKIRMQKKAGVIGSSTESHVSYVLASRMSSRPLG